jgi:hypothetical protein
MSKLGTKKAGTTFGSLRVKAKGQLSDDEWARIMLAVGFPPVARVIAEGLAVLHNESGGVAGINLAPGNPHVGPWAEGTEGFPSSEKLRLDPVQSTKAAYANWYGNAKQSGSLYGNFEQAWGQWEAQQGGKNVQAEYPNYIASATAAIKRGNGGLPPTKGVKGEPESNPSFGEELPLIGGVVGDAEGLIEGTVGAGLSAAEFIGELAETLLDFQKLGTLAAEAFAWFIRLLAKAIWDYVVAPLVHWNERAVTWYWNNFFGVGTEKGSGVGYFLRENAGLITITFWGLGYAILWTDGESIAPTSAQDTMLGSAVKGIEGKIARRNLVKPKDVDSKTPTKPAAKSSTVPIEKTRELAVARKRPVAVTQPGSDTGRNTNERQSSERVERPQTPQSEAETPEIIQPVERPTSSKNPVVGKVLAKPETASGGKTGQVARSDGSADAKGN